MLNCSNGRTQSLLKTLQSLEILRKTDVASWLPRLLTTSAAAALPDLATAQTQQAGKTPFACTSNTPTIVISKGRIGNIGTVVPAMHVHANINGCSQAAKGTHQSRDSTHVLDAQQLVLDCMSTCELMHCPTCLGADWADDSNFAPDPAAPSGLDDPAGSPGQEHGGREGVYPPATTRSRQRQVRSANE